MERLNSPYLIRGFLVCYRIAKRARATVVKPATSPRGERFTWWLFVVAIAALLPALAEAAIQAGFAERDITPALGSSGK